MSTNFVPLIDKQGTQPGNNYANANLKKRAPGGGGGGAGANWEGSFSHVKQVTNASDEDFQTGRTKAPVVTVEIPQSVNILIDSRSRLLPNLNPFDFRIALNANLFRSRFMKLSKVVVPKPPNITKNNNNISGTLNILGFDVQFSYDIPPGFYNTTSLGNQISVGLSALTGVVFTVVFDPKTRTFSISTFANLFFLAESSSFLVRGSHMVPWPAFPIGSTTAAVGALLFNSGVASMLYTRYIFVCSTAFNYYSFADSKTSDTTLNEDILAIADMSSIYNAEDWDIGRPFSGGIATIETPNAPNISLRNPQRNLSAEADIYVLDEYGTNLNEAFDISTPTTTYPPNQVGIAFWTEVTFP